MKIRKSLILFVGATAFLWTVAPASAASALYRCALGIDIAATYAQDSKTVTLYMQGRTLTLPIALSGSGAKYSDGKTTLWEHQGEALIEMPGASFTGCKVVPLR